MADDVPGSAGRPVAEAFDLILREYPGYDDEKIKDLPFDRFRQMVDVIQERQEREERYQKKWELSLAEAQVSVLGQFLAGLAQSKKQARAISSAAQKLDFASAVDTDEEAEQKAEDRVPSTAAVLAAFGARPDGLAGVR